MGTWVPFSPKGNGDLQSSFYEQNGKASRFPRLNGKGNSFVHFVLNLLEGDPEGARVLRLLLPSQGSASCCSFVSEAQPKMSKEHLPLGKTTL